METNIPIAKTFMKNVKIVNCMKGSAWMFPSGIAPFGNSQRFLHKNQIRPVRNTKVKHLENNYYTIISTTLIVQYLE